MGWFATAQALKNGQGAYGTVKESLHGESDPPRTLSVAIHQIIDEILAGNYVPDKKARARLLYWARRNGMARPTLRAVDTATPSSSGQVLHK
ncbi:MAG: hypothetical protein JETCAE02_26650 [Anaerolineaceae bacterium]|jgi:hypothetical protein|nr:MAG: hypothetical protein JETCAE02_26650 [Anaerolineaceae bacterium]